MKWRHLNIILVAFDLIRDSLNFSFHFQFKLEEDMTSLPPNLFSISRFSKFQISKDQDHVNVTSILLY